jgi:hypothetical protein
VYSAWVRQKESNKIIGFFALMTETNACGHVEVKKVFVVDESGWPVY